MRRRLSGRIGVAAAVAITSAVVPLASGTGAAAAATPTYYRPADGVFHLAGHGFGHGHGMSQWGAYGGAESGKTYQQILAWYYASPTFGTAGGTLKVQITSDSKGADGHYDTEVKPVSGLTATDSAGNTLALPTKAPSGTAYDLYRAVLLADGSFRVQAHLSTGWTSLAPSRTGATVTTWTGWVRFTASGRVLTLVRASGGTQLYRDALELDQTSGANGISVNRVTLEHYLAGVVSSEMPCSWTPTVNGTKRLDALEAQAVAARSYAAWRRQHPRSSQVDLVDSTSDQAYHGYSSEQSALTACPWTNPNGTKTSAEAAAVAATAGEVMVDSNAKPIFAQYSASNGGFETSGSQSYLPSRPDAWDGVPTESWSSHSWTDSFTAGQVQAAYPGVGSLSSITVTGRESLSGTDQNGATVHEQWGGRITGLTLTGSGGSVTTTGASFAAALGLMSPWFTIVVSKPASPGSVAATPGDAQATVRWTAPSSDGGGGIRGYTVTASPAITPVTVAGSARSTVISGLRNDTPYVFSVVASNTAGTGPATSSAPVTPSARVVFHPLPPTRVIDTRSTGGALKAGVARAVRVTGVAGVPSSGVVDVALDVVSLDSTATSGLVVYPHGGPRPPDPQLTWKQGDRVNALVPVKVGSSGLVDTRVLGGSTQLFVEVQGYWTAASAAGDVLTSVKPYKLFDSRPSGKPVGAGTAVTFPVVGRAGVPTGATAVVVQLTAAHPKQRDYVRAWGTGASRPGVYDLYAPAGRYTDTTAVVPLTSAGGLAVSPVYATHLVVSLLGWFTTSSTPSSGVVSLLTPATRVYKTTVPAHGTVTVALGVPVTAAAALVSVTGTGNVGAPLSVYAAGVSAPSTASLHLAGTAVASTVTTPLGSGKITIRNAAASSVRVAIDVLAWSAR